MSTPQHLARIVLHTHCICLDRLNSLCNVDPCKEARTCLLGCRIQIHLHTGHIFEFFRSSLSGDKLGTFQFSNLSPRKQTTHCPKRSHSYIPRKNSHRFCILYNSYLRKLRFGTAH